MVPPLLDVPVVVVTRDVVVVVTGLVVVLRVVWLDVVVLLLLELEPPVMPNQARSMVSCTGTVWPTFTAEYPMSCVPSPYTICVYPDCGVLDTL